MFRGGFLPIRASLLAVIKLLELYAFARICLGKTGSLYQLESLAELCTSLHEVLLVSDLAGETWDCLSGMFVAR